MIQELSLLAQIEHIGREANAILEDATGDFSNEQLRNIQIYRVAKIQRLVTEVTLRTLMCLDVAYARGCSAGRRMSEWDEENEIWKDSGVTR